MNNIAKKIKYGKIYKYSKNKIIALDIFRSKNINNIMIPFFNKYNI